MGVLLRRGGCVGLRGVFVRRRLGLVFDRQFSNFVTLAGKEED
jgi:hypothetical protein